MVEEHFAALRHSSLDEETSITTNFFSKRQFLKLNTVGQVRKNAIMHISCHYLNSMKPVHLLTMREEPPGIVHCSLSLSSTILRRKIQKFWDLSSLIVLSLLDEGCFPIIIFSFEKKSPWPDCMYMAKNVSLWPSGLELYIIEKKKASKQSKTRGNNGVH